MAFKLFVSHSSLDTTLVEILRSLSLPEVEFYIAEDDPRYGDQISEKIEHEIDVSDALVAFLTKHGSESASVNQEVGYAKKAHKRIIAVVEDGTRVGVLIQGVELIRFSKDMAEDAVKRLAHYVGPKAKEKRKSRSFRINVLLFLLAFAVFAAVALVLSSLSRRKRDPQPLSHGDQIDASEPHESDQDNESR